MRKQLKQYINREIRFTGVFERFGNVRINDKNKKTIILSNIYNKYLDLYVDHIWLKFDRRWRKFGEIEPGSLIAFDALIGTYCKHGGKLDYGLKNVKNIVKEEL